MAAALKVEVDSLIKELTLLERSQIPFACKLTVQKLAKAVAKEAVPAHMKQVFQSPNNLTLRSLNYKVVSNHEARLDFIENINKGNSPTNYLAPVTKQPLGPPGTKAYETKFSRFVKKAGIVPSNYYPIPFKPNLRTNSLGKPSQGEYSQAWSGLNTSLASSRKKRQLDPNFQLTGFKKRTGGFNRDKANRYFSIPDNRNVRTRQGSFFDLSKGIYRVKGRGDNGVQLLFTYAERPPTVPKIFDPYGVAQDKISKDAVPIFKDSLRRALA
jgi:hypothetical protein